MPEKRMHNFNALNISILVTPSTYGFGGSFYPNLVQARLGDYIIFEKNIFTDGNCRIVEANEKGSCVRSNSSDAYVVEISDINPKVSLQLTKTGKIFLIDDGVNENCINDTQCELDVGNGTAPSAKTSSANTSPAYTSAASPPGYAPTTADTTSNNNNNGSSENIGLIVGIIGGGLFTLGVLGCNLLLNEHDDRQVNFGVN
nr:1883_t:CDS:2 [Entrophospora candida]